MIAKKWVIPVIFTALIALSLFVNPVSYGAQIANGVNNTGSIVPDKQEALQWLWSSDEIKWSKVELSLPFDGYGYVTQGNDDKAPSHADTLTYAWDFVKLSPDWNSFRGSGSRLEDYYTWGASVLAPAPGKIIRVVDYIEDNEPGYENRLQKCGNYIIIKHNNGQYSQIDHFKRQGILVRPGDIVERGQMLGYAGNSGWSYKPHIHYQLQEGSFPEAQSIPYGFSYYVEIDYSGQCSVRWGIPVRGDIIRNGPWPRPPGYDEE